MSINITDCFLKGAHIVLQIGMNLYVVLLRRISVQKSHEVAQCAINSCINY